MECKIIENGRNRRIVFAYDGIELIADWGICEIGGKKTTSWAGVVTPKEEAGELRGY